MNSTIRILLALALGFVSGFVIPLGNGQDLLWALQSGLGFALLIGCIVAILSWGMDIAIEKGYPGWMGFLLALVFNVVGLLLLVLLPGRAVKPSSPAPR